MKSLKVVILQSEQVPEINIAEETLQAYKAGSLSDLEAADVRLMIDRDPHLQKYYESMDDALDDAVADCMMLAAEDTSDIVDLSISLPRIPSHDQVCDICDEIRVEREQAFSCPDDISQEYESEQQSEYDSLRNVYDKIKILETADNFA